MKKIDHIGIAVPDLEAAIATYTAMGFAYERTEEVPAQQVRTAFFKLGESRIELLEATTPDSPIAKFIERRGPGIHHVSVEVEDLDKTLQDYKAADIRLAQEPSMGAGGHRVAFVHPKATGGVLLEVMEHLSHSNAEENH